MHAIVLAIVLFLSNGQAITHVELHELLPAMSAAEANRICHSIGDDARHNLIGAVNPNDKTISITDVEYTCGIVNEAKPV